jgi:hypothetical protein
VSARRLSDGSRRAGKPVPHRLVGNDVRFFPVPPGCGSDWCHPRSIAPLARSVLSTRLLELAVAVRAARCHPLDFGHTTRSWW